MLDIADLRPNAIAPAFGDYGALHVRWGKAKRGGPPRRRTVLSVFDWAVYLDHGTDVTGAVGDASIPRPY